VLPRGGSWSSANGSVQQACLVLQAMADANAAFAPALALMAERHCEAMTDFTGEVTQQKPHGASVMTSNNHWRQVEACALRSLRFKHVMFPDDALSRPCHSLARRWLSSCFPRVLDSKIREVYIRKGWWQSLPQRAEAVALVLGCGAGGTAVALAEAFPRVLAMDASQRCIDAAKVSGLHMVCMALDVAGWHAGCGCLLGGGTEAFGQNTPTIVWHTNFAHRAYSHACNTGLPPLLIHCATCRHVRCRSRPALPHR